MRLAITLPTRGRPKQLIDTIDRSIAHWEVDTTVMYVMTDRDDTETQWAFLEAQKRWNDGRKRVVLSAEQREDTIAAKWNRVLTIDPHADVYCTDADDAPQITPGYDRKILEAAQLFPDGIGCVFGHMANASFTCSESLTNRLVKKLGYIFPEYFPYWFVDHWIDDIAKMIGRISFADIRTDQSTVGKTQEFREPGWWATWYDAAYLMRRAIAYRIVMSKDFDEASHVKQRLLNQAPLIEFRSRWINDHVRANNRHLMALLGRNDVDERYKRIRQRAVDMLPQLFQGMPAHEISAYRQILDPPPLPALQRAYSA